MPAFSALHLVTLVVISASVLSEPVEGFKSLSIGGNDYYTEREQSDDTLMSKFSYFFDKVSNLFTQPRDSTFVSRDKRGAMEIIPEFEVNSTLSNETSFEYYEKQYFINKTRKILEEYLGYFRYLERLKNGNSSASGTDKNQSSGDYTVEPIRPSALPQVGETTTDKGRTDPILEEKLRELNALDLNQLMEIFENAKRSQKDNLEDISIASVCCHYG